MNKIRITFIKNSDSKYKFSEYASKNKKENLFKEEFTFSNHFCRMSLNNTAISIYKNKERVALVEEYKSHRTRSNPVFFTHKEWDNFKEECEDMNEASSLEFAINRFFGKYNEDNS